MKVSAISDIHIKDPGDDADRLLQAFLDHPQVRSSDYVMLLGDIFDLMCGPHDAYLKSFSHLFAKLKALQDQGTKVYFFEGNHDVHLEALFKKFWPAGDLKPRQHPLIEEIEGKVYYFSHGDEHEVDNLSYQRYKSFILSPPLKFVADHLMPYAVLNFIGKRASKVSRKKGSRSFDAEAVRAKFREGVLKTTQGKYDFVLGGHSHVQDQHKLPEGPGVYVNNGYALRTKTFILIDSHQVHFVPLG
ncbi:MAG TPA: UDP-2,3-diacylglucosamine diphosphatase [Bacteriovoracaceae bacterium]|nr:UDP-2,3-diacylglucosamine diphosphatase [Bacteriovoracaceae bacterium]